MSFLNGSLKARVELKSFCKARFNQACDEIKIWNEGSISNRNIPPWAQSLFFCYFVHVQNYFDIEGNLKIYIC